MQSLIAQFEEIVALLIHNGHIDRDKVNVSMCV